MSAPSNPSPVMGAREWVLLGVLSLLWGGSFFFGKVAVAEWPPLMVVLPRVGLASLTLYVVVRLRGLTCGSAAGCGAPSS